MLKSLFKLHVAQRRIILYIVVITIPFFGLSLYLIDTYVGNELRVSAFQKAHITSIKTLQTIKAFFDSSSRPAVQAAHSVVFHPELYQDVLPSLKEAVGKEESIFGSALALEPGGLVQTNFCSYYYQTTNGVGEKNLIPPSYDYLHSPWYLSVKNGRKPMWGEPYFDEGGGNVYMSTYSHPMFRYDGTFLGVVTVDVELRHLATQMKQLAKVQDGYVFLVSHDGFLLYHPDYQATLKENLEQYAKRIGSKSLTLAAESMRKKDSGVYKVTVHGKSFLLYTMPVPDTQWNIGVMQDYDALFAPLRGMKFRLLMIMICGLGVILLTVVTVTNQLRATVSHEERTRNELAVANAIQRSFLPEQDTFERKPFSLCGMMQPAKEIGGDFYGYREAEGKLLFYIGDVSGKGIPASLFMMASHVLIETTLDDSFDPARVLQRTSEKLYTLGKQRMFATMLVGVLDAEQKTLTFALAGHPPPLIKEGDMLYSPLAKFLPPVGVFEFVPYENRCVEFSETALVLGFTDGVTEAMTRTGDLFGMERLAEILVDLPVDTAPSVVRQKIEDAVQKFINGNDPSDDLTLVAIKMERE